MNHFEDGALLPRVEKLLFWVLYIYIFTHTHTYIYKHTLIYICIYTYIYTYTYIYIYTHAYTHVYTYTCIYIYIYILFHILFHYSLFQDVECSSLCYTLFIHSKYNSLHLLIPSSHSIPPRLGNHKCVLFVVQKLVSLIRSHLFIFVFISVALGD